MYRNAIPGMSRKALVTGGAGFIGSSLVDRLLQNQFSVVAYDNLSTGQEDFLLQASGNPGFSLVRGDVLDRHALEIAMEGCDWVFHMAANADVRSGLEHPGKDLEQNTVATFGVLESMRSTGAKHLVFPSTGSVYGEPTLIPTPEDAPFPVQTSLYGASKLACEGLIQAYCEGFGLTAWIFRFVSILGERYTHGHVVDFYNALSKNPNYLTVLGDGSQRKSYLHVQDCVDAIFQCIEHRNANVNTYNLGTDEYCSVRESVGWITAELRLQPQITYTGGSRGWIGDNPFIFLDCSRVRALGWRPRRSIQQAIALTVRYLQSYA
jgi:UDP-glucose 4-epimerase